jgi:FAD/FMN-containing dehydrogenase
MQTLSDFKGNVISPGDHEFGRARLVYDRRADKRPAIILCCSDAEDVVLAINHARTAGLAIAVRGGGHGFTGRSTCDGGVLIDLSAMNDIVLDEVARTVTVGAGVLTGDVLRVTAPKGLAPVTCAGADIGVVGAAIFAGQGHLSPRFGNMCDNVIGFDIALPDGRLVHVSETDEPDLFWAVRGAGDNFGIVTSMTLAVHAVPSISRVCTIEYDTANALKILQRFRDHKWASPLPWVLGNIFLDPVTSETRLSYFFALTGTDGDGDHDLAVIEEFGPVAAKSIKEVDWLELHSELPFASDCRFHIAQRELPEFDDSTMSLVAEEVARFESFGRSIPWIEGLPGAMILFYPTDAAMGVAAVPANAYSVRGGYDIEALAMWREPSLDMNIVEWAGDVVDRFISAGKAGKPSVLANSFVDLALTKASFGGDFERLGQIKQRYDPANIFGSTAVIFEKRD